jgi:hypothetical protein
MKAESEATPNDMRPRGGRPRLDRAQVRDAIVGVRLSPAEHDAIRVRAAAAGLKPSELFRLSVLKKALPPIPAPAANRAEYSRLAGLSNNLNQIARLANSGAPITVDLDLLAQVQDELARLRLALIGVEKQ